MSQPTTAFFIEGRLHKVFEMEAKNATFSTRDFVIEAQGQFPQLIKFQLVQDRCGLIDSFNVDEPIKVHFDLRGREWNGKYLTNLHAWKLDRLADETPTAATENYTVYGTPPAPQGAPAPIDGIPDDDDMPF
jgi:hypothetical protein